MPLVLHRPAAQDQPDEIGRGEVKLLAMVDTLFEVRQDQAFEIIPQAIWVVYAIQKTRRAYIRDEIISEHRVGRGIEL